MAFKNRKDIYEVLEVPKDIGEKELKKVYRKLAIKYHPDKKPGNEDLFKEITYCYNIILDKKMRFIYDRWGFKGLDEYLPEYEVDFYEMFEIEKTITKEKLEEMWENLLKNNKHGPPDLITEKMNKINYVFEILTDDELKEVYDEFGMYPVILIMGERRGVNVEEEAVDRELEEIDTKNLFPNGNIHKILKVTLRQMYEGCTIERMVYIKKVCPQCRGFGEEEGSPVTCMKCGGFGGKSYLFYNIPLFLSSRIHLCPECSGKGTSYIKEYYCKLCNGWGNVTCPTKVPIIVRKGDVDLRVVEFPKMGHEMMNNRFGNLYFTLEQEPHPIFKRFKDDLFFDYTLTLTQALCGFEFDLDFLGIKSLKVIGPPGPVYSPGIIKMVPGKGMPTNDEYGNLFVRFSVIFPSFQSIKKNLKKIKSLLPPIPPEEDPPKDIKITPVKLSPYDKERLENLHHIEPVEEVEAEEEGYVSYYIEDGNLIKFL